MRRSHTKTEIVEKRRKFCLLSIYPDILSVSLFSEEVLSMEKCIGKARKDGILIISTIEFGVDKKTIFTFALKV